MHGSSFWIAYKLFLQILILQIKEGGQNNIESKYCINQKQTLSYQSRDPVKVKLKALFRCSE